MSAASVRRVRSAQLRVAPHATPVRTGRDFFSSRLKSPAASSAGLRASSAALRPPKPTPAGSSAGGEVRHEGGEAASSIVAAATAAARVAVKAAASAATAVAVAAAAGGGGGGGGGYRGERSEGTRSRRQPLRLTQPARQNFQGAPHPGALFLFAAPPPFVGACLQATFITLQAGSTL